MKIVKIDQDECIGCESCVELCPGVFAFDDKENKAYVVDPKGGDQDCVDEAIASCPVSCITSEEE